MIETSRFQNVPVHPGHFESVLIIQRLIYHQENAEPGR